MDEDQVRRVRKFNRTVSQRIGALNHSFLNRGRPLGEARLLFEIGHDGAEVRGLRARLELDSGYVSRLLRSLEHQGLMKVQPAASDGRVRRVTLTRKGLRELAELDRRSDAFAKSLLAPLTTAQRDRLIAAMTEVERLMRVSAVATSSEGMVRLRVGSVEHVLSAGAIEEDDDKLGQAVTNMPLTSLKRLVGRQAVTKNGHKPECRLGAQ